MIKPKSVFTWGFGAEQVLWIVDLYDDNRPTMSVTNDMENVIEYIYDQQPSVKGFPIVYMDTEKVWDEVKYDNGVVHFKSLNAESLHDAIQKVKLKK